MLVLTRKEGESLIIGDDHIRIHILEIKNGTQIRIGIDAPKDIEVNREEIYERKKKNP